MIDWNAWASKQTDPDRRAAIGIDNSGAKVPNDIKAAFADACPISWSFGLYLSDAEWLMNVIKASLMSPGKVHCHAITTFQYANNNRRGLIRKFPAFWQTMKMARKGIRRRVRGEGAR
jgi:hypothetical protein